jgi:hypothetical protein
MSNKNDLVRLARGVATHTNELAKALGLKANSPGTFHLGSVEQLVHTCKEEKPSHLHHWVDDKGNVCLAASWYGNAQQPFITFYTNTID